MSIFEKINPSLPQKHGNTVVSGPKVPLYGDLEPFPYEVSDRAWYTDKSESAILDYNVALVSGVESALAVPNGTTKIEFQYRENYPIYWSFAEGNAVGRTDPYRTLKSTDAYYQEYDGLFNETLYLSADNAGTIEVTFIK